MTYTWMPVSAPDGLTALPQHVPQRYAPGEVAKKLAGGMSDAVKGVLIESNYVDKDYRSTFYNFYAKKGRQYDPDCVRLHLFDSTVTFEDSTLRLLCPDELAHHYFGYIVLRPTEIATIGRSVVSPDVRSGAPRFVISADHKVHLLGYRLAVQGFPSMDQHVDISVCAHVACWSILRHYSERYSAYREYLTYDITLMAQEFNPGGLVPSKGLQVSHAERVFQEAGTFPVHVARGANGVNDVAFYRQLLAYVDSGFPLFAAMHTRGHAIAVVGYAWRPPVPASTAAGMRYAWDLLESLAVVDDNYLPYMAINATGGTPYSATDIDAFIVALPEKVYYPADAVDRLASVLFSLSPAMKLPPKNETIVRYFITTGSALRRFVRKHESEYDPKLVAAVMTLPFAQFVWIIEFATDPQWQLEQVTARAVVDATASLRDAMPLWLIHTRDEALVFDRSSITPAIGGLKLNNPAHSAFTRMGTNLRPTQAK